MTKTQWAMLVVFLGACFAAAAIGGFFTADSVKEWYPTLRKPSWTPPSWVFGPVWTLLYAMMGVAAWLVWKQVGFEGGRVVLAIFLVQLILNAAWSVIFFGMRNPGAAFAEITILWLAIAATVVSFWRVAPIAGALLLPYLAWVSFAVVLNWAIWRMNSFNH